MDNLHALAEDGEDFGAGEGAVADGEDEDGKSGYIDKTGMLTIAPQFDVAYDFKYGVALVSSDADSDDHWGFIDKTGKVIVPLRYRRAEPPTFWYTGDGLLRLLDGNETFYFDTTGKQIWPK